MTSEKIVLIDSKDRVMGAEEKLKVHEKGIMHRAFSIIILNSRGEMLIQRRAIDKYHSGGLWSNACCSHQRENEILEQAIHRRLKEEMGFDCSLKEIFHFKYKTRFNNHLIENEIDHVFIGLFDGNPIINKKEVLDFMWIPLSSLKNKIKTNPEKYSYWFKIIINKFQRL